MPDDRIRHGIALHELCEPSGEIPTVRLRRRVEREVIALCRRDHLGRVRDRVDPLVRCEQRPEEVKHEHGHCLAVDTREANAERVPFLHEQVRAGIEQRLRGPPTLPLVSVRRPCGLLPPPDLDWSVRVRASVVVQASQQFLGSGTVGDRAEPVEQLASAKPGADQRLGQRREVDADASKLDEDEGSALFRQGPPRASCFLPPKYSSGRE